MAGMSEHGMFHVSLAGKCRILFGLAVVLIIAAALFVPWYSLETLVQDRNMQRARHLAVLAHARLDPASSDWVHQQGLINQWLSDYATRLHLPATRPRLIKLDAAGQFAYDAEAVERALVAGLSGAQIVRQVLAAIPPPVEFQIALAAWQLAPSDLRRDVNRARRDLLTRLALAANALIPRLDKFEREAVTRMREKESLSEISRIERAPGQPTVCRFILAVRGEDPGLARRPLLGLIDVALPVPDLDEAVLYTRLVIVLAGMLAGFLAILVFYLITQKLILAPVRELRVCAERVTEGDLTARSEITTGDEFEELSVAFNTMLTQLERSRVELETINRSLDTRLGELAETNVALYESNRLKSEFLANVSHELRTPLTSIIGFADLLRDLTQSEGPIDEGRAARYANNILTSGRMLLEIINDLLDLAKIEAGKVELHRATFSLTDVCEGLGDFMRPLTDKKNQTLTLALEDDLPLMNSDAGKIRQILYNLLSNAVKYTPEGGTIRLEARLLGAGQRVQLVVSDTGPGIAPEHQLQIFEKFRQLDSSVTREHSGTGLGLAISRELATMLGGTIRLESQLGAGSKFIVELPVESPESARRPLPSLT